MVGTAIAPEDVAGVVPMRELRRALGPCVGCAAEILLGFEALVGPVLPSALEVRVGLVRLLDFEALVGLVQLPGLEVQVVLV